MTAQASRRFAAAITLLAFLLGCASSPGKKDPKEAARVNTQLGTEYMAQGQTERAKEKLERALELDTTYAPTHAALAVLYQRMGRGDDAKRHFERALQLDPHDSYTRNNYGAYLCGHGRTDEAMDEFDRVLKDQTYTTPAVALANAGVCARKIPDLKRAELYFRKSLEYDPQYPEALAQMARLSYDRRQFLKARAFLQRLEALRALDREQLQLGMKIETALDDRGARSRYEARLREQYPDATDNSY